MPFFDPIRIGASGVADTAFTVDRSLRFNDGDSPYLNRTPSSASNRRTFTFSFWVKRANLGIYTHIFGMQYSTSAYQFVIRFDNDDKLSVFDFQTPLGGMQMRKTSNAVFRDVSAWYHIVAAIDTTQSTGSNRNRIYVNGNELTSFDNDNTPSQNHDTIVNTTNTHFIGQKNSSNYFDGYLAEFHFIDGQQLTPSSFGETNATTGQWIPKDTSGLTYGTNGYRLKFDDNSGTTATTLGKDTSGNSNNFTPNNFSVSAGQGNDSLEDTPTNNFATINGSFKVDGFNGTRTLSQGNLAISGSTNDSSGDFMQAASIPFPLTGKWYVEANVTALGTSGGNDGGPLIGIMDIPYNHSDPKAKVVRADGKVATTGNAGGAGNSQFTSSFAGSISQGDVWQLAYDADNRYVYFGRNNNWANGSGSYNQSNFSNAQAYATQPTAGVQQVYIFTQPYSTTSMSFELDFNFGQRAFAYTPPTGYEQLKSANLPDPTILLPNEHFDTLLWTGNATTSDRSITGLNFQPDWAWTKTRSFAYHHALFDSVRGPANSLNSDQTFNENYPNGGDLASFDNDGITWDYGSASGASNDWWNVSGYNYVAWNWNAGTDSKTYTVTVVSDSGNKYRFDGYGTSAVTLDLAEGGTYIFNYPSAHPFRFSTTSDGTHGGGSEYTTGVTVLSSTSIQIVVAASAPNLNYYCSNHSGMGGAINTNSTLGSSNFDGTGQAVVKANTTAGFSIVSYTGNSGSSGSGVLQTIGHGLGVTPQVIIMKSRSLNESYSHWAVYHHNVTDANTDYLKLESTAARTETDVNYMGQTLPTSSVFSLGYNFTTNKASETYIAYCFSEVAGFSRIGFYIGNGRTDGTFVFCGFRPAWLLIKKSSAAGSWVLWDNKRNPHNVCDIDINPNRDFAEDYYSNHDVDFLSNGFKFTYPDNTTNQNAYKYVFIAFAESPFKNARAR